ncbi:MAG: F0F1 ATP synthase subunit A [Anaerolineae bacterium]
MNAATPQVVFTVMGIPVRNTVVATWIMMGIVVLLALLAGALRPTALEMLVEFLHDTISDIMGQQTGRYLPLLGSLAIFITFANTLNVIPGLVSPTADVNTALALSLVVFASVHYFGIRSKGLWGYLSTLASPIFLLPFELLGQVSRTISLTLRLFGNMISGQLIVAIIVALVPLFVPLPLVGLGIFTGLLQAYIFTALAAVFIAAGLDANQAVPSSPLNHRKD